MRPVLQKIGVAFVASDAKVSGMGVMYALDAIAAMVIGGTSLVGGLGRVTGTVIGVLILGEMMSGFIRIDAYYQQMAKLPRT